MGRLQRDYEFPVCEQVALEFRSSCLFSPFLRIFSSLKDTWLQNVLGLIPGAFAGKLTQNDCGYQVQLSFGRRRALRSPPQPSRSAELLGVRAAHLDPTAALRDE